MIGKITTSNGFSGTIAFATDEFRARILFHTLGEIPAHRWAYALRQMALSRNPQFFEHGNKACIHISLSAPPGEYLTDIQWRDFVTAYLEGMGWSDHDHIAAHLEDRPNDLVRIVLSRIGRRGQIADLRNDYPRQKQVLAALEKRFGLRQVRAAPRHSSVLGPTRFARLT